MKLKLEIFACKEMKVSYQYVNCLDCCLTLLENSIVCHIVSLIHLIVTFQFMSIILQIFHQK